MADDVLLNKAATIERCVARAREEYNADPANFARNHTHQNDAVTAEAIRRITRCCVPAVATNHAHRRGPTGQQPARP